MFVPAVVLVAEQAGTIRTVPRDRRWLVLALLLLGGSGAKGAVLPVLIGGLILYHAWRFLRDRSIDIEAGKVLALTLGVFAVTYVVLYRGENEGLRLSLQGTAAEIPRIVRLADPFRHIPIISTLFWIIGNAVWVLMLGAAPLAGLVWLFKQRGERAQRSTVLLLAMLIAGLFPYFFLVAPAYNQLWFTEYGYVAAAILSAQGLCLFWRSWQSVARNARSNIALLAVGSALGGVLLTYLGYSLGFSSSLGYASWAAIVIAIAVACFARTGRRGQRVTVLALLPIMVYGALRLPVQIAPELVENGPEPFYANNYGTVPGGLVVGLDWIRNHTSPNSVLAVNNYYLSPQLPQFPGFMFYSALSERQVYLEGWTETAAVLGRTELSAIVARRIRNDKVFQHADPRALAQMVSQADVDYLLVDRVHGTVSPDLSGLTTLVYSNNAVAIYAVRDRALRVTSHHLRPNKRIEQPAANGMRLSASCFSSPFEQRRIVRAYPVPRVQLFDKRAPLNA
jgi:putative effector of murein hydrolase